MRRALVETLVYFALLALCVFLSMQAPDVLLGWAIVALFVAASWAVTSAFRERI